MTKVSIMTYHYYITSNIVRLDQRRRTYLGVRIIKTRIKNSRYMGVFVNYKPKKRG